MLTEEKEKIKRLKQQGFGYMKIANLLGISVNTIKSFCKRRKLECSSVNFSMSKKKGYCLMCGQELTGRKDKMFCSRKCRYLWHKEPLTQGIHKGNYECACKYCGKKFFSYGDKKRKYCSHECYVNDRFGEVEKSTLQVS